MLEYSSATVAYIKKIHEIACQILANELGFLVKGNRFVDKANGYSYPISIVIFESNQTLGYFDPAFYELGFNKLLMSKSHERLTNVIRHELAHYALYLKHADTVKPHGNEFKNFCAKMGWDTEVSKASFCESSYEDRKKEDPSILRKVKKLIALSESSNVSEAEQAMLKSQKLLLKHHLESPSNETEEVAFVKRVLFKKSQSAKLRAIAKIVETFFVSTIFHKGRNGVAMEVLGEKHNVEIAEYIASTLDVHLDLLWKDARKKHPTLSGKTAKNSFFTGVAKGYCEKVSILNKKHPKESRQALICIENRLEIFKQLAYPKLSFARSRNTLCHSSSLIGKEFGKSLRLTSGLTASKGKKKLLSWFR